MYSVYTKVELDAKVSLYSCKNWQSHACGAWDDFIPVSCWPSCGQCQQWHHFITP